MKDILDIFDINDCIRQVYKGKCASSLTVPTICAVLFSVYYIYHQRTKQSDTLGGPLWFGLTGRDLGLGFTRSSVLNSFKHGFTGGSNRG